MFQSSWRNASSSSSSESATSKTRTTSRSSGCSAGPRREQTDEGCEREPGLHGEEVVELGHDLDGVGRETDLLVRLPQRRGREVGIDRFVELAPRERDLALVGRHRVRVAW